MNGNKLTIEGKSGLREQLNIYLSTIVHELRNPLVSIQGFTSLLAENFSKNLPVEGTKYLERIFSNISRLEYLLSDISKLAKVTISESDFEIVSTNELIKKALESFELQINQRQISIDQHLNMPQIYCDSKAIIQVYTNLISNAIKYSRVTKNLKIEFGYQGHELFHKFYVKDNGIGIKSKDINKVFRIFCRLHNRRNIRGSGLGLSIVKRIIEGHGGEVWLKSRINHGTTVFFTLPKNSTYFITKKL